MLTLESLKKMQPGVFITGTCINNPPNPNSISKLPEIYMTNSNLGREMKFVAKRGFYHDWAIYLDWSDEKSFEEVESNGNKLYTKEYIQMLVPCDDEAMNMYRF